MEPAARAWAGAVVVVTGASRGIGRALALSFGARGCRVGLAARSEGALRDLAAAIEVAGGEALVLPVDLRQPEEVEAMARRCGERWGGVDLLVNNAGVPGPMGPLLEQDPEALRETLEVNLLGPLRCTRALAPWLRARPGARVVNLSSGLAEQVVPGLGAYAVSKAALAQLTRVLAAELRPIEVLSFDPGEVDTAMQAAARRAGPEALGPELHAALVQAHAEGWLRTPEAVAEELIQALER